jgi:SAM-dependent methyltransferase
MNKNIEQYYSQRVSEYEKIYQKPERQESLKRLKSKISIMFHGRDVLEVACGTGYWTQWIAESAKSICAVDCSTEVLNLAEQKNYLKCQVSLIESDAYSLQNITGNFNGGFCGFWWSHIPKSQITDVINTFHSKLTNDALVALIDNRYVKGSSTPISRTDREGNTYQIRQLDDGTEYEIMKNFPDEREIEALLAPYSQEFQYIKYEYYWLVQYNVKK